MASPRTKKPRKQTSPPCSAPLATRGEEAPTSPNNVPQIVSATKLAEYRAAIFCGIIASILFMYFLDPILSFIARLTISLLSLVSQAVLDRIYAQASHLHSHDFAFLLFLMYGLLPIIGVACAAILRQIFPPLFPPNPVRFMLRRRPTILAKCVPIAVALIVTVFALTSIGANWYQLRIISDFEHHIRILAPFITDQEEEELIGELSLMASQKQFVALRNRLDSIAKTYAVTLPPYTIYSPTSL